MISSCFSRWVTPPLVDNSPRGRPEVVNNGNFKDIDKDEDGVISKTEFIEEKEKVLDERNSGYLWVFGGIITAVAMACCVPFVYMFTTKHVKLQWAKVASRKKRKEDEPSTEV
tara:strand:+ start:477 stop:815 length:339 start_codon:yes stop_codon:yes gene_type:complete